MSSNPPDDGVIEEEKTEETDELLEEIEQKRSLRGPIAVVVATIAIAFSAFQMYVAARGFRFAISLPGWLVASETSAPGWLEALTSAIGFLELSGSEAGVELVFISMQSLQVNTVHVTFALLLTFLMYPSSTGDGVVARTLGRIPPALEGQFGADAAPTRAVDAVAAAVRWAVLDPERSRVTPIDVVLVFVALLPAIYTVGQFDEIRQLRAFGLGSGRPLGEVYPFLEPVAVGPLATTPWAFVLGVVGVLLVLEATRRALGLLLMSLVSAFIVYARLGYLIPRDAPVVGVFSIPPLEWTSIVRDLWYNTEAGIFGIPVTVSVSFIYIFILFGAFLEMSGAGKWFIDLAYSLTGTRKGGPAKASVVSSGFMGMLSGSSVANTVTTGAFTIPLMKRSGYKPAFSGAVEASASSGGQILPPVMGAAAFLIVQFTGTPFREVVLAAVLPALAFFFGMWVMVHFEAVRRGVGGLDRSELLDVLPHLKYGWFYLAPIALLLYYIIVARLSVGRAGWLTILVTIALIFAVAAYDDRTRVPLVGSLVALYGGQVATQFLAGTTLWNYLLGERGAGLSLSDALVAAFGGFELVVIAVSLLVMLVWRGRESTLLELDPAVDEAAENVDETLGRDVATTRPGEVGSFVLKSMESGARTAVLVVVAVAAAGIIPGVISVSGLGPNLTSLVISASGGSLILMLLLAGIAAIILGMGMPTTVMYIILISVLGNALEEFGIALLAAHLFVLYLGLMADVTPPVMVAAYAAAGVAKADAFETGKIAFLLSLNKIMVPFAFVFAPGILLIRDWDPDTRELDLVGLSDVADVGYFVPEVLVPVVGMFAGVYALGVTIIGYQTTRVTDLGRALFATAAVLLMVPGFLLSPATTMLGSLPVDPIAADVALRLAGGVLLVALVVNNRRRAGDEGAEDAADEPPVTA